MRKIIPTLAATLVITGGAYATLGNPDRQRMEISADPMCQSIEQTVTPAECEKLKFALWVFDIEYSPRVTGGWRDPETTREWLTEEASKPMNLTEIAAQGAPEDVLERGQIPEQSKLGDVFGTKTPQDEPIPVPHPPITAPKQSVEPPQPRTVRVAPATAYHDRQANVHVDPWLVFAAPFLAFADMFVAPFANRR